MFVPFNNNKKKQAGCELVGTKHRKTEYKWTHGPCETHKTSFCTTLQNDQNMKWSGDVTITPQEQVPRIEKANVFFFFFF